MDFGTIKKKLNHNIYEKVEDFLNDMSLVFNNCRIYNGTESYVGKIGVDVRKEYNRLLGMYNFVERFQNSTQVHPSVSFINDLQQKNKTEPLREEPTQNAKETENNNKEDDDFPIPNEPTGLNPIEKTNSQQIFPSISQNEISNPVQIQQENQNTNVNTDTIQETTTESLQIKLPIINNELIKEKPTEICENKEEKMIEKVSPILETNKKEMSDDSLAEENW